MRALGLREEGRCQGQGQCSEDLHGYGCGGDGE